MPPRYQTARIWPSTLDRLRLLAHLKETDQVKILDDLITQALMEHKEAHPESAARIDLELSKK